jgi:hypothetical protein
MPRPITTNTPANRGARAFQRALRELKKRHPDEFRALLEAEKAREGVRTLRERVTP